MRAELHIAPDGTLRGMHSDELLPLVAELGQVRVERASHVEFDNARQAWGVAFPDGRDTGQRFTTRAEALAWEREHFWSLIGF